ncbi:hypothetical protein R2601_03903 [Salipiger bermudensis HTCC2601]|uniref:Uncharacterized protein n=1 Tax=Salipiger bermudensis (strain DSM 26914 / JCM 13377 / KCTC 12554 / HTCC2601) TaxID=314265 RepID=Q0FW65_SALBH|nr:hypothetical protein R2601_03903 [Salipiger bermudensis HTCC2601]
MPTGSPTIPRARQSSPSTTWCPSAASRPRATRRSATPPSRSPSSISFRA